MTATPHLLRRNWWPRALLMLSVAGFGAWIWSGMFLHVRDVEATVVYPQFEVAAEPLVLKVSPGETVSGTVRRGQSLYTLLSRYGVKKGELYAIVNAAKPVKDLNRIRMGQGYRVGLDDDGRFRAFELDISSGRMVRVSRTPFGFVAVVHDIVYDTRPRVLAGTARSSLFSDLIKEPGGAELIHQLHDLFAWRIDFNRDIRKGDTFRVLADEVWRNGVFDHFGQIRYAQVVSRSRNIEGVWYDGEYYDPEGQTLRGALLPSPVNYSKISSRFSKARRHPVYGKVRPHYGVDMVAPYGAPVRAAGNGTVTFVGKKGANGRLITIRHKGAYRTAYAHLSRFAGGLRRGQSVRQGQVIGYVGNSGTSTGTHLHYGIYRYGKPVDPLKLDYSPVTESIDLAGSSQFQLAWDEARLTVTRMETQPLLALAN